MKFSIWQPLPFPFSHCIFLLPETINKSRHILSPAGEKIKGSFYECRGQVLSSTKKHGGDGNGEPREEIRDIISEMKCLESKRDCTTQRQTKVHRDI